MKRIKQMILLLMLLALVGCGANQWKENYDLGMQYLMEGDYEQAILSFTAAIEIDPKRADAYIGRGDAYIMWSEADADTMTENSELALTDYLAAIELDHKNADTYLKAAEIYIELGDLESAKLLLEKGIKSTNDLRLSDKLEELEKRLNDSFFNSPEFVAFDILTPEMQAPVVEIVKAIQAGNIDAVYDVIQEELPIYEQRKSAEAIHNVLRTFYSDYKMEIIFFESGHRVEIRPETGMAYGMYCPSIEEKDRYVLYKKYFRGECVDWNLNGWAECGYVIAFENDYQEVRRTGNAKDCLYIGTVDVYVRNIFDGEESVTQEKREITDYFSPIFGTGGFESYERVKKLWWN